MFQMEKSLGDELVVSVALEVGPHGLSLHPQGAGLQREIPLKAVSIDSSIVIQLVW